MAAELEHKLTIVKCQLGSKITQDRLKAVMLASAEDISLKSDDYELVASFAGQTERRILQA